MTRQEVLMTFAQGTREILKSNLSKLMSMVPMPVVIIKRIQILML